MSSAAGQEPQGVWTDADQDGLPDAGAAFPIGGVGDQVTLGVHFNSLLFQWTNFIIFVGWDPACFSFVSANYTISGGLNFPIDTFSNPAAVGFAGFGYDESGISYVGNMTLQYDAAVSCCVDPIIDYYNPYYTYCALGAGIDYFLFAEAAGSCFSTEPTTATDAMSWGQIKGLYR